MSDHPAALLPALPRCRLSRGGPAAGPTGVPVIGTMDNTVVGTDARLRFAVEYGGAFPQPGGGHTGTRWELLAGLGAQDLQLARVVEPHVDALAILAEAGRRPQPGASYGVFAAEGPGCRLAAVQTADGLVLRGEKPWCSLGTELSHALVTAWVDERQRGLFEIDLRHPGVRGSDEPWVARGLREVRSTGLVLDDVPATPVGGPGWYLERDGFAHGGLGVAAVWYGAAYALGQRLAHPGGRAPDQVAQLHVGSAYAGLEAARALLSETAAELDAGRGAGPEGALLALTVRSVVHDAAEDVLRRCDHGMGPAPLATDEEHAARVADLRLYLRQHHAERDQAGLGRLLLERALPR